MIFPVTKVDPVCSAATITREREREVDFCVTYLNMSLAVVKRNGISTDVAITGLRLGVRRGTTAEAYVSQHTTVEPMHLSESNDELYALLSAGALDAAIDDSQIARWFSHSVPGVPFAGALPGPKRHTELWCARKTTNYGRRLIGLSKGWPITELA